MATLENDVATPAGLAQVTRRMADYMLATSDPARTDRLFPAHFQVFGTNPMSVAYGACGPALFLHRVLGEVPAAVRGWMLDRPLGVDAYPPSLYMGLAGIAYTLAEIGEAERGAEVMATAYQSPLLYAEPGMFLGAAGWGWASLYFWDLTRDPLHLEQAVSAGEHLLRTAEREGDTLTWRHAADGKIHYGYGYGAAGVGLFLLYLGLRAGRRDFVDAAVGAVEYELAHRLETVNGTTWRRYEDDMVNYPYHLHGGAGIGTVMVRFARLLDSARYREWAEEIARGVDMKWTVFPGLLHGLAGLGEFAWDMHRLTGDPAYLARAEDHAATVLWWQIEASAGIAFPGRMLLKACSDWATGAAGIGLFLHRLVDGSPRELVDLDGVPG